jgi:hypothetical protein
LAKPLRDAKVIKIPVAQLLGDRLNACGQLAGVSNDGFLSRDIGDSNGAHGIYLKLQFNKARFGNLAANVAKSNTSLDDAVASGAVYVK